MLKKILVYKKELIALSFIAGLYFLLRLPHLTLQPIFADEAIYIRWAQVMKAEPTLRFLPVSDGKTPLYMWTMIPFFKIFEDPLYAGRFLSIISGIGTLGGVVFLGWRFFNLRAGVWAAFLVAVTPFMVFFDRMALVDSMLAAFSIWALNFSLLLVRHPRLDLAMFAGYLLGGGLLTKTPGMFNLLVLPVTILAANLASLGRQKRVLKIVGLWIVAVAIALVMYNFLRLGPEFNKLSSRNQDYIFSPSELVGRPLDPFIPHFNDMKEFWGKLLGIMTSLIVLLGVVWIGIKKNRSGLVVLLWALIPLLIEMALLKTFTARYVLSSIPPLLCLGGWAISEIEKTVKLKLKLPGAVVTIMMLVVLVPYPVSFSYTLLTRPAEVNLPKNDHKGYFEEWTAGYGFSEIAQFLIGEAKGGPVVVVTEGFFGTLPDGLQVYLEKYVHSLSQPYPISVIGSNGYEIPEDVRKSLSQNKVYFIANRSLQDPLPQSLKLLKEYPKDKTYAKSQSSILLFQVLPREDKE